jgi:predicted  nucleic acid-binding Zn-ribbon protein
MRTIAEISATGAAWITEYELQALVERISEMVDTLSKLQDKCDRHEETIAGFESALEIMKEENVNLKEKLSPFSSATESYVEGLKEQIKDLEKNLHTCQTYPIGGEKVR